METDIIIDKEKPKVNNRRIHGLDLLRIVSVINIIEIHINKFGRLLNIKPNDSRYKTIWNLEAIGYGAVDTFGLISGIVGYKRYKFSNLMIIWLQISFYSSLISIYLYFLKIITLKELFLSFLPILVKRLWYINAFFSMYLFLPFIITGINNLNRKTHKNMLLLFFIFFIVYNRIGEKLINKNNFHYLNNGQSTSWLMILFIFGAYFGKYIFVENKKHAFVYWAFWIFIYFVTTFFTSFIFFVFKIEEYYNYISISIVIQGISLVFIFAELKIKNKILIKIISFSSQFSLNVIFIHTRLFLPNIPIKYWFFGIIKKFSPKFIVFKLYGISIIIYIICSIIDYLRLILFKYLKIKELCIFIESKMPLFLEKIDF